MSGETKDPKRGRYEKAAGAAAARMDRAAMLGRQLSLLPGGAGSGDGGDPGGDGPRGPGRPKGAKNKRSSKLRQMLAARGFRMPEDVLAEIAGLNSREPALVLAMRHAEQVIAWAFDGNNAKGELRLAAFLSVYKEMLRALDALMPYGLEKATPDENAGMAVTTIIMPGAGQATPGDGARVIEGRATAFAPSDFAPPPMPGKTVENQPLSNSSRGQSDSESRTE